MGEMADAFLSDVIDEENLRTEYLSGGIDHGDAYDLGLIDELGFDTFDRDSVWTPEYSEEAIDNQLEKLTLQLDNAVLRSSSSCNNERHRQQRPLYIPSKYGHLNALAIINLTKEHPTCNICEKQMNARTGKYGKFYWCSCDGQKTVSERYWQGVRITDVQEWLYNIAEKLHSSNKVNSDVKGDCLRILQSGFTK